MMICRLFKLRNPGIVWVIFLLAGCTDSGQKAVRHDISIAAMQFTPDTIVVQKGDTLVFTNNDMVDHDISDFPAKRWASPKLQPGDTWTYIPMEGGTYFCSIHQIMKGEIIIK